MTRVLPSFADLMLLPEVLDPQARVRLERERIVIRTDRLPTLKRALGAYPHVAARRRSDTELVLEPLAPQRQRVVLVWPGCETLGVTVWPDGFVSLRRAGASLEAALEGDGVELVRCRHDETLTEALAALGT